MKTIAKWFEERPATKAAILSAVAATLGLIVLSIQTCLLQRQAAISETQTTLLRNQLELNTRPFIDVSLTSADSESVHFYKLNVQNNGMFSVKNVQVTFAYFGMVAKHGWWVSAPAMNLNTDSILPHSNSIFSLNLKTKSLRPTSFQIEKGTEFVVFFIGFERAIDGKAFLYLKPAFVVADSIWPEDEFGGTPLPNVSGALSQVFSPSMELAYEFLRRRPLRREYELYNSSYPLGFTPSGKLGKLEWIK
jgi:hypothetical protein